MRSRMWLSVLLVSVTIVGCKDEPIADRKAASRHKELEKAAAESQVARQSPRELEQRTLPPSEPLSNTAAPASTAPPAATATVQQSMEAAMQAMSTGDSETAWQAIQNALLQAPDDPGVVFLTARIMAERGQVADAVELLGTINSNDPNIKMAVDGQSAEWLLGLGRLTEAEPRLLAVAAAAPDNPAPNRLLQRMYNAQGRRFESEPFTRKLIQLGSFQLHELSMLCNIENQFRDEPLREAMEGVESERHHKLTYDAREALVNHRYDIASELLKNALDVSPQHREAWVWYGYVQAMNDAWDTLPQWLASKPPKYDQHPQFWNTMGLWYEYQSQPEQAIQAFRKALDLDPRSLTATQGMASSLITLENLELAEKFRQRSYRLGRTNEQVRDILRGDLSRTSCLQLATDYGSLGWDLLEKTWKAIGVSLPTDPSAGDAGDKEEASMAGDLPTDSPTPAPNLNLPVLLAGLNELDLPNLDLELQLDSNLPQLSAREELAASIRFEEVTEQIGLATAEYDWGRLESETGVYIYRSMGGGVAVSDYDLDGWPDLLFSRAGAIPSEPLANKPKQLFRNLEGAFVEVSSVAIPEARGFGQGLAVGDFDQDGYPDFLVANIGSCNLYRNNGDGTYSLSYSVPLSSESYWVSACALADVNRDGLPDIVLVMYIGGSQWETEKCSRPGSQTYNCPPQQFPGCDEVVMLNRASEGWEKADDFLQGQIERGRSLGLLVGDFDQAGGNEMYVTNDTTANHYFVNEPASNGSFQLMQRAGAAGVAVDFKGRSQGSMGIAVADIDRNGLEDIYVTNAFGEYNSLYLQEKPNLFVDKTRGWNLYKESLPLVGFGCQIFDMDNDGWQDIIVVNGGLDDYEQFGEQFKMHPLLYQNASKQMQVLDKDVLGAYSQAPTIARGLATTDFDRDGKLDVIITHCERNAAALHNQTDSTNHAFQMDLVGVESDRDAIGARVTLTCGTEKWTESLVVGEGYYSASERLIHIGIGTNSVMDSVMVTWPSGKQQEFKNVAADRRYMLVEGSELVVR